MAILLVVGTLMAACGCGGGGGSAPPLVLAASSVLEETGILEAWVEDYHVRSGRDVETVMAPDIEVMAMAEHGECDLLITHYPNWELSLESSGYVEGRQEFMHDDYVLVGPPDDPAGVAGAPSAPEAFARIADSGQPFVQRVDGSGTAGKEEELWGAAGEIEYGDWLLLSEAGMTEALRQAEWEGAYTLSDRSTFQQHSEGLSLRILFEGGDILENPYHVMVVSGLAYPDTDLEGAQDLIEYLMSDAAREFFSLGAWEPRKTLELEEEPSGGGDD
ncbi:MAG: hypothetical protein SWK76_10605 [Actinomycetota bacterium]|nr:hypothetical protein [Actinomycetota bacterium]